MSTVIKEKETSISGLDCFNCELHAKNVTGSTRDMLSTVFSMPTAEAQCKGVREQGRKKAVLLFCEAYNCASRRDVEHCMWLLAISIIC